MWWAILYFLGFFITFCIEAYFAGQLGDKPGTLLAVCLLWFVALPIMLAGVFYDLLKGAGEKSRQRKEEKQRIRIAEEEKNKFLLQESEVEVENFVNDLQQKNL